MTVPLSQDLAVTTASILRWLERLTVTLHERDDLFRSLSEADTLAKALTSYPELAQRVLAAAATDPDPRLQQWASCSTLAPPGAFLAWLQTAATTSVSEEVQRLMRARLAASDAPQIAWILAKRWEPSAHFEQFVGSPVGVELVMLAIDHVRSGDYQRVPGGFHARCVATGHRLAEWVEAGLARGPALSQLGVHFDLVAQAKLDPLLTIRAFCTLSTRWEDLERFGGTTFGRFPDTQRVNWPRDVLKVILANHPDKDVRLQVLRALEPPGAETPAGPSPDEPRTLATAAVELLANVFPRRFR